MEICVPLSVYEKDRDRFKILAAEKKMSMRELFHQVVEKGKEVLK